MAFQRVYVVNAAHIFFATVVSAVLLGRLVEIAIAAALVS
jgi:hypothetical protein